jgi:CobQ-like glutamine amidotransferase family enzyme
MDGDTKSRDDALDYVTQGGAADYEKHIMSKQLKYSESEAKKSWYDRMLNLKE